jgi:hypothetical protein
MQEIHHSRLVRERFLIFIDIEERKETGERVWEVDGTVHDDDSFDE